MAKDINLLPDITLNEEKSAKQQKLLTVISMAILIVGLVGVLGAITVDLTMGSILEKAQADNDKLKETVRQFADVEIMQRTIKAKLTTTGIILTNAKDIKTHLQNIQALLPENGISIQSVALDKANRITISGKAADSQSFKLYIANILSSDKGTKFFDDISLGSVSTTKDGSLQFSLTMELKKVEASQ